MKIQSKIFLLVIVTFGVTLLVINIIHHYSVLERSQFIQSKEDSHKYIVDLVIKYHNEHLKQVIKDYSAWDATVLFAKNASLKWQEENLNPLLTTYGFNYLWVYNIDCKLITYISDSANFGIKTLPIPPKVIGDFFKTKPFTSFFINSGRDIIQVFGGKIVPTSDFIEHASEPQGYIFIGINWDKHLVAKFSKETQLAIQLLAVNQSLKRAKNLDGEIKTLHIFRDWQQSEMFMLVTTKNYEILEKWNRLVRYSVYGTLLLSVIAIMFFFYFTRKWIILPLHLISNTLNTEDATTLHKLQTKHSEFGKIAHLIFQFFEQKKQLQEEIAERKQTTQNLQESEEKYRKLLDLIPDLVLYHQGETILYANRATIEFIGYSYEEFSQLSVLDFVAPECRAITADSVARLLRDEIIEDYEIDVIARHNKRKSVVVRGALVNLNGMKVILVVLIDITERKRIEKALKTNEERFRILLQNSSDIIAVYDVNGNTVFNSQAARITWDSEDQQVIGGNLLASIHPFDLEEFRDKWDKLISNPYQIQIIEYRWQITPENYAWTEAICCNQITSPIINGIVVNSRDITQRKMVEEALKQSEAKFRILVESLPDIVVLVQGNNLIYANSMALKFFGCTFDELRLKNVLSFIPSEHYRFFIDQVPQGVQGAEMELFNQNQERKSMLIYSNHTTNGLDALLLVMNDITERKEIEKMLQDLFAEVLDRSTEIETQRDEIEIRNRSLQEAYALIQRKNMEITSSIEYAKRIQQAILPPDSLFKSYLPESFVIYMPKDIVSGDFYWIAQKSEKILFAAVDCTGHGVPGAFMTFIASNLLNEALHKDRLCTPAEILNSLAEGIKHFQKQSERYLIKDGMDLAMCSLDYQNRILEYAGVYNPLYIIRHGEVLTFRPDKVAIGDRYRNEDIVYHNYRIELQDGDNIYIMSDGYIDQFGGTYGRKFMSKRIREKLIEICDLDMETQKEVLEATFEDWKGDNQQIDDVLIIGVKV